MAGSRCGWCALTIRRGCAATRILTSPAWPRSLNGDRQPASVPGIDAGRFCRVLGADWGWWRTVLRRLADETPKSVKWRMRAGVGDKVRWYELPEEVDH